MSKTQYYQKESVKGRKKIVRIFGLLLAVTGIVFMGYFSFPILLMQVYLTPVYASSEFDAPIPNATVVGKNTFETLLSSTKQSISGVDYTNARNWFPNYKMSDASTPKVSSYSLSIPKLNIDDAEVSTIDYDVGEHLVNYGGTAVPPERGNAVVFGHSTLPQLYKKGDYKTIFANLHTLKVGDAITIEMDNITYTYKVFQIKIVEPEDTSVLIQDYGDSYLTIITCTPPGTIWKRLVVKSRLERL